MMNKEQFIAYMNQHLAVIKEDERKDIIDEYINHIDEKVSEGMSEEEVIESFGNIDEMIKEILDAYNIDPQQAKSTASGFDKKVNEVLDVLFEGFQSFLSKITSMDVDSIVRLMFEVLVVLLVLAILRIPFEIMESIGASLLKSLFGYGIGSTFAWIWHLICSILYIVMFIVALINVTSRRWTHFKRKQNTPIMDDVKESFNFEQAKEAVRRFTEGASQTAQEEASDTDSSDDSDEEQAEKTTKQGHRYSYEAKHDYENHHPSLLRICMQIFGFLFMIPFIMTIVVLCCLLAWLIAMSFQGVTVTGFYFLVIGAIIGCSAVISLIDRYLCKGGH